MFKSVAISYSGTQKKLADLLGISQEAVSQWDELIPEKRSMQLERITNGTLKHDTSLYAKQAA